MATLGGYAQRQSQTASAADTTLQALMMLMQYQQQAEDRRLSREQMMLQNEQLQGLLRAQQREEVAQTSGTAAIRNISDVEDQSAYSRLDQTIKSLNTFMDSPELATDPVLNADLGLSAAVRSMQSGSPEEYAKVIRVLNSQLKQVQSMIDSSEVPAKEAERFMKSLRGRIKNFAKHSTDGVIFQRAYLQVLSEDNARGDRGADGELISASKENPEILIPDDPLIEVDDVTLNSFGKQAVQAGIDRVVRTNVDSLLEVVDPEDAEALTQHFEDNPEAMTDLGLASDITAAAKNMIENIPPAQESFIDRVINYAKEKPGTTATGVIGGGYLATKFAPLLKYVPPVAGALTGAEILGRMGQEQGLLPGEGVFVGDDSMLQGSMSKISRAQELQERLPEGQRVGPIEGVFRGIGEAAYDAGEAAYDALGLESLFHPMGPFGGFGAADPAPQTAAAPAEGVIEKEVVRRDFGAEIPEQVTLEDLVAPAPPARDFTKTVAEEGETVEDIAQRVYGSQSPVDVNRIMEANRGLADYQDETGQRPKGDLTGLVLKIPNIPYDESSDLLDIEMQPSEIPAQADPKYIEYLEDQALIQKAKEARRELAALTDLARETNTEQNKTFKAYEVDPATAGAETAEQYLAMKLNQAIADNPDIEFAADGSVVETPKARQKRMAMEAQQQQELANRQIESLEARQKRMASETSPSEALGRRSLLKNESLENRQARMAQTNKPETPLGARSALTLRNQQLTDEMLDQYAIDNLLQATQREQQAQALLSQLVAEQPVYNTAPQMDQMQIQHLLQTTLDPRSLYALMGQPF